MGRAWAVGQARSPGQLGTVARRAKLGPARSGRARPGLGPGRAARFLIYNGHTTITKQKDTSTAFSLNKDFAITNNPS